jgi:hypothetical protein
MGEVPLGQGRLAEQGVMGKQHLKLHSTHSTTSVACVCFGREIMHIFK